MNYFPFIYYRFIELFKHTGANWDRLAPSENNAIDFAHNTINPEPLTEIVTNRPSWEYCLAHNGEGISNRFREGCPTDEDIKIFDMVSVHSCKNDLVLYRGVCDEVFNQMIRNAYTVKNVNLYDKGFMSCSLVKGHELDCYKTKLRIFVPGGSCVIYLGNVNNEQNYYEVVIQRGAKLRIISIDGTYINCVLIGTD